MKLRFLTYSLQGNKHLNIMSSSYQRTLYELDPKDVRAVVKVNILRENGDNAIYTTTAYRYFDRHICINDCDDDVQLVLTVNSLRFLKIGYAVISSSKDKYWVITDIVDKFDNCRSIFRLMRGDSKYATCVSNYKRFDLRITPKNKAGYIPKVIDNKLQNAESINFVKNLEEFWRELAGMYRKS